MDFIKKLSFVLIGLILTSLGIKILSDHHLTFGGTAGISTIFSFLSPLSWGTLFFIVNLPFFLISIRELGKWFTISSLLSITGISLLREWFDQIIPAMELNMLFASILSGLLIGIGVTFVLNNGSSLGGIHILGLYMDKKYRINRGIVLFVCDSMIILLALALVGWLSALFSILCIFIASNIIGRYKKSPIKEMDQENTINSHV
ncbi:YitT family protein [Metabacillus halosaccharovorans]|uniref:YitT family protein n=1 Tax=Metabacillus halosaccharovorans TaxID=930124 RepID=UPI00203BFE15|nr:YitT family protein [Metabacillus halosaccharovorans]MCM3442328.1 YitT family protein [Metabacillus halosaccharovorans]